MDQEEHREMPLDNHSSSNISFEITVDNESIVRHMGQSFLLDGQEDMVMLQLC